MTGAPRDELGRTLKVKQWLLLSARENLEHRDKLLLNELMEPRPYPERHDDR